VEPLIYSHATGRHVTVTSHLDTIHVASIQGPRSRAILQRVASDDLSAIPYHGMAETRVCDVPVVLTRTGYTAELGFDIYVDVPRAAEMFEGLWQAGRGEGLLLCGSQALAIRRIEAAILNVGQDFDWRHSPYDVGLGWMVNLSKPGFVGHDALARAKTAGARPRIAGLRLRGATVASQGDPVMHDGRMVGRVTSATWGPTVEAGIAMAMLDAAAPAHGTRLAITHDDTRLDAEIVPLPFLDPERKLAKA
jgi:aminomethyltransferase